MNLMLKMPWCNEIQRSENRIVAPMITADGDYSVYEFQRDDGIYGLSRYELDERLSRKS